MNCLFGDLFSLHTVILLIGKVLLNNGENLANIALCGCSYFLIITTLSLPCCFPLSPAVKDNTEHLN